MSKKIGLTRKIDSSGRGRVSTAATVGGQVIAPPSGGGAVPTDTYVQRSIDLVSGSVVYATGTNTIASEAQLSLSRGGTAANLAATQGLLKQANAGDPVTVGTLTDTEHGTRGGGSLHAEATTSVAGFLSAADKTKLDSVSSGASVSSVAISVPALFTLSGSPITTSGTIAIALATQTANTVFAGPSTGSPAAPTFRALVATDIPNLDAAKITTGTLDRARLPSAIAYEDEANTFTAAQAFQSYLDFAEIATPSAPAADVTRLFAATTASRWLPLAAQQAANATAFPIPALETFDWTPVFRGSTTEGVYTFTRQFGRGFRLGNWVVAVFALQINTITTPGGGNLWISGLPYTSRNTTDQFTGGGLRTYSSVTLSANYTQLMVGMGVNQNYIQVFQGGSGQAVSNIQTSTVSAGTRMDGFVIFETE